MVQAGAVIGVADIHTRPLAHRIEPAQDLDRLLVIDCILAIGCAIPARPGRSVTRRQTGARRALACGNAERTQGFGCGVVCHIGLIRSFRVHKVAASCPSRTDRNWASCPNGAKTPSPVPVSHPPLLTPT